MFYLFNRLFQFLVLSAIFLFRTRQSFFSLAIIAFLFVTFLCSHRGNSPQLAMKKIITDSASGIMTFGGYSSQ